MASFLGAGDIVLLKGPIGAGKSLFARALILELLDKPEDIPSPTFTLVQTYTTPDFDIWHCDLYRLTGPDEALELGLDEAFETALCIIEWPERLADTAPKNALTVLMELTKNPHERHITLSATDPRWRPVLGGINA